MGTLSDKDRAVLKATVTYGVMTPLLAHLLVYSDLTPDAARKALERLRGKGWLREYDLPDRTHYYVLSFRGAEALEQHRVYARNPGYTKLIRLLGIGYHCARHGAERMNAAQFRRRHPELCPRGARAGQYFLLNGFLCFGHVDSAQSTKTLRGRINGIFKQRSPVAEFKQRIEAQTFRVVIITASEDKRWLTERAVRPLPHGHLVSAVVVPELFNLLEGGQP
jgi:hypothetical protein